MTDHYQVMTIVAGAIRGFRSEIAGDKEPCDIGTEESNCMAKAIISALEDSGLCIEPVANKESIDGDKPGA